jgi:hypothetical protein
MQLFALAIGAVVVFGVFYFAAGLRRNIAAAKASGLPYVIGRMSLHSPKPLSRLLTDALSRVC